MIVKVKSRYHPSTTKSEKYLVKSEAGDKNLGGPYNSRAEAVKRLQQVEYFRHGGKAKNAAK
mgnify:FL=1